MESTGTITISGVYRYFYYHPVQTDKNATGKKGEDAACKFLTDLGFIIVERNRRYGRKEIDIIVRKDNTCRFVEVKTRRSKIDSIRDIIDKRKQKNIIETAQIYLEQKSIESEVFFDVIIITQENNGDFKVDYIPDAFSPFESF